MTNPEPPEHCRILKADIGDLVVDYTKLLDWGFGFLEENYRINKNNKIEYDVLYRNIGDFYRLVINTSRIDLDSIAFQERLIYAGKRNFAAWVKDYLREMLVDLEDLQHPEEENPFYEHL